MFFDQAFSPNELPKPGEFLSKQTIPFNPNEICIDPPSNYEDLLRRYQVIDCWTMHHGS